MRLNALFGMLFCISVLTTGVAAQSTLDAPVGELQTYFVDSGLLSNERSESWTVHQEHVRIANARWLRLYFGQVKLEGDSYLRVTSVRDGEVQKLTWERLKTWTFTTAYFNGDTVIVELVAAPGTTQNQLVIEMVATEIGSGGTERGSCGICEPDERVPSSNLSSGRLWPVGCTGTMYNDIGCFVTAGHCLDEGIANVIQFNVPASDPDCDTNNPSVNDQFPVINTAWFVDGPGADWGVGTVAPNDLDQLPSERFGTFTSISEAEANVGNVVENYAYGLDNECERSQTQQFHSGSIVGKSATFYLYEIDITFGGSGSALIKDDAIVGIVSHCGECDPQINVATRIDINAFETLRMQICQDERPLNNNCENAELVTEGSTAYTTIYASTDGPDESACGGDGQDHFNDIWFRYQPACFGDVTVDVCNGDFNNTVTVYGADCPTGDGEAIACDRNSCDGSGLSVLTFVGDPNETYLIRVSGRGDQEGSGTIDISCIAYPPANDNCADASVAVDGANAYTTLNASTDGPLEVDCGFPDINGLTDDVWFRYVATCDGNVTADVCSSDFNNSITVYEGACPSGDNSALACDENGCGTAQATVTFAATSGTEYWLRISGKNGQTGSGSLDISCDPDTGSCVGDIVENNAVDVSDLLALLAAWGDCAEGCPEDLNDDNAVNVSDLLLLLGVWGPCP